MIFWIIAGVTVWCAIGDTITYYRITSPERRR